MSFGGAVAGMINSLKSNKALRGKRKSTFEHLKDAEGNQHTELKFKQATEKEMENFRREWELEVKTQQKRKMIIAGVSVIIAAGLICGFIALF